MSVNPSPSSSVSSTYWGAMQMPVMFTSLSLVVSGGGSAATDLDATPRRLAVPARVTPRTNSRLFQCRTRSLFIEPPTSPSLSLQFSSAFFEERRFERNRETGSLSHHGQPEAERRALARFALDPDASTVQLDEFLGERKPEARTLVLARGLGADLAELLEDGLLVFAGDPDARVHYGDLDRAVGERGLELNPPPGGRELHSVGEEVEQHLLDLALVADQAADPVVHGQVEGDSMAGGTLPHEGRRVLESGGEIEGGQLELHPASFDLGQVQDIVDQGEEVTA